MRKLLILALVSVSMPSAASSDLDAALSRVPSIADLCGAVPIAPKKVRGSSVHHPVRRAVKTFIDDTNDWLACAADKYVIIQQYVDAIEDERQREALVTHLNKDFRNEYALVNTQTQLLAERVNYRMKWTIRPDRPPVSGSNAGYSNSAANVKLRTLKKLTDASNITRPVYDPRLGLLAWQAVAPPQFKS